MALLTTGTSSITFTLEENGCSHEYVIPLYCPCPGETKDRHLWGWACCNCWDQAFYPDLDERCEAH